MGLDPREVDGRTERTLGLVEGTRQRVLPPLPLTSRPVSGHLQAGLVPLLHFDDLRKSSGRPNVVEALWHRTGRFPPQMARRKCYLRLLCKKLSLCLRPLT